MAGTTVIIGAAQGIGEAVARRLALDNSVVLADIQLDPVEKLAKELSDQGANARALHVDLTSPESVASLIADVPDADRVAIVAGMFKASPSLEVTPAQMNEVLAVNLVGVYDVARGFAEAMAAKGGGAICAVGSIAARMPRMRQAAYCASKAGMRQALRVLGMEVIAFGVRVNFVAPGPTATAMMSALSDDHTGVELWHGELETSRPRIPDQRVGLPKDIAAAVHFLLSEDSSHIALHDLYVDGGESLGM